MDVLSYFMCSSFTAIKSSSYHLQIAMIALLGLQKMKNNKLQTKDKR